MLSLNLENCLVSFSPTFEGRKLTTYSSLPKEDRQTITKSPIDRRIIYLDRTPFSTSQDQDHYPERSLGQHCLAADIRPYACGPHWSMPGMYEIGGKEYLEG
jgi:hypothetical protein